MAASQLHICTLELDMHTLLIDNEWVDGSILKEHELKPAAAADELLVANLMKIYDIDDRHRAAAAH